MSDRVTHSAAGAGHVFWLFGLSGAGKTTLAERLREHLAARDSRAVLMLDGDRLRRGLCRGLKFSQEERLENLRRAAEVARLGLESGITVIAAFITPLELHRATVREIVGPAAISLIYVKAPLVVCQQRDVKGLYAQANSGTIDNMTGLGSAFEPPLQPDLTVQTDAESPEASSQRLIAFSQQFNRRPVAA